MWGTPALATKTFPLLELYLKPPALEEHVPRLPLEEECVLVVGVGVVAPVGPCPRLQDPVEFPVVLEPVGPSYSLGRSPVPYLESRLRTSPLGFDGTKEGLFFYK